MKWEVIVMITIKLSLCVDVNGILLIELCLLGGNQNDLLRI